MPKIQQKGLELTGLDLVNKLQRNSPRDHGYLAQWFIAEKSQSQVTIRSPAYYAGWVNDGHRQEPGRFIPGSWSGGKFRYKRGAKTGMVLKRSYVPGKKFVERSIAQVQPRIKEHFKVAIKEVLG